MSEGRVKRMRVGSCHQCAVNEPWRLSMNRPVAAGILPAVEGRHLATRKKPRHYQGLGNAATVLTGNAPFHRAGSHGSTAGRMPAATDSRSQCMREAKGGSPQIPDSPPPSPPSNAVPVSPRAAPWADKRCDHKQTSAGTHSCDRRIHVPLQPKNSAKNWLQGHEIGSHLADLLPQRTLA